MASIFISYRREDSSGHAGRLCDRLSARFGDDRVFMDIQDIHPGQNFVRSIEDTIATCDGVVAVIGPRWLEMVKQRAQLEDDFVRHEISAALRRGVTVIPVLVGGARMPDIADLPIELAELGRRQAIEVRDEKFAADVDALEDALRGQIGLADASPVVAAAPSRRGGVVAAAILVAMLGVITYLTLRPTTTTAPATAPVTTPQIAGEWIAQMQKSGQPAFRIRLRLQQLGDKVAGVVEYPTGDGPIHDAVLEGRALTFATTHVPQFASGPATIRFQAQVEGDQITLLSTDDSGVATGVARRVVPTP